MLFRKWYYFYFSPHKDFARKIEKITGFVPIKLSLYQLAFKHKSVDKKNNERLEFLGDTVLDAIISHEIYLRFSDKSEGDLSKLRAKAVSRNQLNAIGFSLKLVKLLKYKIPTSSGTPSNLSGNTLEALVGAVYLDVGYDDCRIFVRNKLLKPYISWDKLDKEIIDFKSLMFNYAQKENLLLNFNVIEDTLGANHNRFEVSVALEGEELARGKGKTKKSAEQQASKHALKFLNILK